MKTAVEWLAEEFSKDGLVIDLWEKEIEQAKEMEKEKIIDAYSAGVMSEFDLSIKTGEQYYNEIIKNK
jgi:hypothetical protein